jgi:U6 snRNA-associated Sm-like protein LSm8
MQIVLYAKLITGDHLGRVYTQHSARMSALRNFVGTQVKVLTSDGRVFMGTLEGYDQNTNLVLTKSKEIILSPDHPGRLNESSGIILRGDDVVCVGQIDDQVEDSIDYSKIFADKLKGTKNSLEKDTRSRETQRYV